MGAGAISTAQNLVFWALKQQTGSALRNYLLCVLADLYNAEEGCAWAGYGHLAERCQCDSSTVRRNVKALEATGLVKVTRRRGNSGHWQSHQYRFPHLAGKSSHQPIVMMPTGIGIMPTGGVGTVPSYKPTIDKPKYKHGGGTSRAIRTRDRSLAEDLGDTSWAE